MDSPHKQKGDICSYNGIRKGCKGRRENKKVWFPMLGNSQKEKI